MFCTQPFRIPLAGKLDVCAFDKTGTLTSDSLNFIGVLNASSNFVKKLELQPSQIDDDALLVVASCQSLSRVDGKVVGDPLESSAFEKCGWKLVSEKDSVLQKKGLKTEIVFRYHFSSSLRRMTTIAIVSRNNSRPQYKVMVKGAPEVIKTLLKKGKKKSFHFGFFQVLENM